MAVYELGRNGLQEKEVVQPSNDPLEIRVDVTNRLRFENIHALMSFRVEDVREILLPLLQHAADLLPLLEYYVEHKGLPE